MMNILVVGANMSGASALLDLLSEYSSTARIPGEFDDFRRSGLIGDILAGYASFPDGRQKQFALRGFDGISPYLRASLRQRLLLKIDKYLSHVRYSARVDRINRFYKTLEVCSHGDIDRSIESVQNYISWIARQTGQDTDMKVFCQPVFLGFHDDFWPRCFSPFKVIFVKRNPIDQLGEISDWPVARMEMDTPIRSLFSIYGQDKNGLVRFHSDAIFARLQHIQRLQHELGNDQAITITFEDLVKNYDDTKSKIESLLGLSPDHHINARKKFNPEVSEKNIGRGIDKLPPEALEIVKRRFSLE